MHSPCRVLAVEKNLDYRAVGVEDAAVEWLITEE